jgi:hypothetical protein
MQKIKIETSSGMLHHITWLTNYKPTQNNIPEDFSLQQTTVRTSNLTIKIKFKKESEVRIKWRKMRTNEW